MEKRYRNIIIIIIIMAGGRSEDVWVLEGVQRDGDVFI